MTWEVESFKRNILENNIALIDVNGTFATGWEYACLTVDGGKTESKCLIVILEIHCGVARNKVVNANCQVVACGASGRKTEETGQFQSAGKPQLKYNDVRQIGVSSVLVEKLLRHTLI